MWAEEFSLREKLAAEIGPVTWSWLRPHHRRGILFLVDARLELVEVAVAVAGDRVERVRDGWRAAFCSSPARTWWRLGKTTAGCFTG